jgi:hypothetical protein
MVDTKAVNPTKQAPYLFHFALSFVKSDIGKPEWGLSPSLSIKKGVELRCSD